MRRFLALIGLLIISITACSQFPDDNPVRQAQYNTTDLDGDGIPDFHWQVLSVGTNVLRVVISGLPPPIVSSCTIGQPEGPALPMTLDSLDKGFVYPANNPIEELILQIGFTNGRQSTSRKQFHRDSLGQIYQSLPSGSFTMGDDAINDSAPAHQVTLDAFALGATELTYSAWVQIKARATDFGYTFTANEPSTAANDQPAAPLSWHNALLLCNLLSEMEGLTPLYCTDDTQTVVYRSGRLDIKPSWIRTKARGYRLPTEAEWEYGCRAGSTSRFFWGDDRDTATNYAWFGGTMASTIQAVGKKLPNDWGLFDITGNLAEWCFDYWSAYGSAPASNPTGNATTGFLRICRGGSLDTALENLQSAGRLYGRVQSTGQETVYPFLGVRMVFQKGAP